MTSEMISYMFVSKANRRISEILELLRQTGAGWLIVYVLAGLAICFFGHYLRRVLPLLVGLVLGFAICCIMKRLLAGGGKFTTERLSNEINVFITDVKEQGFGYIKTFFHQSSVKMLTVSIIGALVCATLGSLLYRITLPLCISVLVYSFATIFLYESANVQFYSILIAVGSFVVLALFYNQLFILSTAAAGAACVGFVIASTDIVALTVTYFIAIILFVIGAAFQFIQFYRRRKRSMEKKRLKTGKANKTVA